METNNDVHKYIMLVFINRWNALSLAAYSIWNFYKNIPLFCSQRALSILISEFMNNSINLKKKEKNMRKNLFNAS